jgi:hypothetical protein
MKKTIKTIYIHLNKIEAGDYSKMMKVLLQIQILHGIKL